MQQASKQSALSDAAVSGSDGITLSEFADEWLAQQKGRLRQTSFRVYESYFRLHIRPRLGDRVLATITVDDAAAVISEMEEGVRLRDRGSEFERIIGDPFATPTIFGVLTVLSRIFSRACRRGLITLNPVRQLEREELPKAKRREFPSLDREAIGKLLANTPDRFRTAVALSVLTGLRQSETLGLRWQDIDGAGGLLRVRFQLGRRGQLVEPKTVASKRDVPIPPSLVRMLETRRRVAEERGFGRPTDFVFASKTGGPICRRNLMYRGLRTAVDRSNLPKLTWHDLRHIAASALIAEGASVPYLARILGHSSPTITLAVYAHEFARAEHAERTRERMEAAFGELLR
jgi:integrase